MAKTLPQKYPFLLLTVTLSLWFSCPFSYGAETMHLKNNKTIEGYIICAIDDSLWVAPKQDTKAIEVEIENLEHAESKDGKLSQGALATLSQKAEEYVRKKRYAEAIKLYGILLDAFPDNTDIRYLRGVLEHTLGMLKEALSDYQILIAQGAADAKILNNLAVIYAQNQEFEQAKQRFNEALLHHSPEPTVSLNLARLFMQTKDYTNAIQHYAKILQKEPDNKEALYNLGAAYANVKNYEEAKKQWEYLLTINPEDTEVKKNLDIIEQAMKPQDKKGQ